ncbi:hypothetical protein BH11PAT4_BH11PAT4_6270 [soil metagenome]
MAYTRFTMRKVIGFLVLTILLVSLGVPARSQAAVNDGSSFILGAWQLQSDLGEGVTLQAYEESLGIRFTQHKWYVDWDQDFPFHSATLTHNEGRNLEITWQPWMAGVGIAFGDIAKGTYDTYIRKFARDVKSLGYQIQIAIAPEMNGWWSPWAINGQKGRTNTDYINGYRRIVDIFNEEGSRKVSWIFAPNVYEPGSWNSTYTFAELYPGDAYVTYNGLDGYNWGTNGGGTWQSFEQVFRYSYNALTAISDKQIIIMEIGCAEQGGDKAAWIRDMFAGFKNFPKIAGFTWFNRNRDRDWRIHSTPASKLAFKKGAAAFFAPPANTGGSTTVKTTPTPSAPTPKPATATPTPQPTSKPREKVQQPAPTAASTPTPEPTATPLAPIPEFIQTIVKDVKGVWGGGASESPGILIGLCAGIVGLGLLVVPSNRRKLAMLFKVLFRHAP